MTLEKSFPTFRFPSGYSCVTAKVGMQRLLSRAERVKQGQARITRDELIFPLKHKLDWNGDASGCSGEDLIIWQKTRQPQDSGCDSGFGGHQGDADGATHRNTPIADRSAYAYKIESLNRIQSSL